MPTPDETIDAIAAADTWDARVAAIRLVPARHGTDEHAAIFAEVARRLYVPHLSPDFAYVHPAEFYDEDLFREVYLRAVAATAGFTNVDVETLAATLEADPQTLLVFRTITGLTKGEFAHSTSLIGEGTGLTENKVDSAAKRGTSLNEDQALLAARTVDAIMSGAMFGDPPGDLETKQQMQSDTADGWDTVRKFAADGVPYEVLLHQRHSGGFFSQLLNATSSRRGDLIEDAVEALFIEHGVPFIRTGAHNQAEIERRFEVAVKPAPDFVVFDETDTLRGMLECKGSNDGGTARDKALRFARLREESVRLNGTPLLAVLGGLGWKRVNDTLGPVVRDCDGRVFTVASLPQMMEVAPFPQLAGLAQP